MLLLPLRRSRTYIRRIFYRHMRRGQRVTLEEAIALLRTHWED